MLVKLILMFVYKEPNYLMTSFKCNSQCTQIVILLFYYFLFWKQQTEINRWKKGLKNLKSLGNKHVNCWVKDCVKLGS